MADGLSILVARIARGDIGAEGEFVARYRAMAVAIAERHCRRHEPQLQDIVQEALAAVLERLRANALRDAAALPAYLQQAIKYACITHYRKLSAENSGRVPFSDSIEADPLSDPVNLMLVQSAQRAIHLLFEELPTPRDRQALRRFYVDGERRESICADLDIDELHFRRILSRARRRLREFLDDGDIGTSA